MTTEFQRMWENLKAQKKNRPSETFFLANADAKSVRQLLEQRTDIKLLRIQHVLYAIDMLGVPQLEIPLKTPWTLEEGDVIAHFKLENGMFHFMAFVPLVVGTNIMYDEVQ